jgi:hypothetical protein
MDCVGSEKSLKKGFCDHGDKTSIFVKRKPFYFFQKLKEASATGYYCMLLLLMLLLKHCFGTAIFLLFTCLLNDTAPTGVTLRMLICDNRAYIIRKQLKEPCWYLGYWTSRPTFESVSSKIGLLIKNANHYTATFVMAVGTHTEQNTSWGADSCSAG